jgi:methylenetetrahydrofolate reductase (NADPH)
VAVAGYPEGHPRIATATLDEPLATKLSLLDNRGLERQIVTQFGFEPGAIGS